MPGRLQTRIGIACGVLAIFGALATSIGTYKVNQYRQDQTEIRVEKVEKQNLAIVEKLDAIKSSVDRLAATVEERQRQEDRRYRP